MSPTKPRESAVMQPLPAVVGAGAQPSVAGQSPAGRRIRKAVAGVRIPGPLERLGVIRRVPARLARVEHQDFLRGLFGDDNR